MIFLTSNYVGEQSTNIEDNEEHRRADFVDSLLKSTAKDLTESLSPEKLQKLPIEENNASTVAIEAAAPSMFSLYC